MARLEKLKTFSTGAIFCALVLVNICGVNSSKAIPQPKAEGDDSDSKDGFMDSIWSAYVFSLLGIAVFVVLFGLLLHFLTGPSPRKLSNSLVNRNHRFQPQLQQQQQRNPLNQDLQSPPENERQYQPSSHPYTSPTVTELSAAPPSYPTQQYGYNKPYSQSNTLQQEGLFPPTVVPFSPPPYSENKTPAGESSSGPYKYLDKYSPQSPTSPTLSVDDAIIPKRAVLRANTPYKVVEEKNKVGDDDEMDGMETPMNDGSYNYNNFSYQNNAYNHDDDDQFMIPRPVSNNPDGIMDSRFVRVLPRYPPPPPPKPGFAQPGLGFN